MQNQSSKGTRIAQIIVSVFGCALFAMFSSLQGNDVNQYGTAQWLTYGWLIGYAFLSIICFANAFRPFPKSTFLSLAAMTFALAIFRATQIDFSQPLFCFIAPEEFAKRNPAGNETGGLVIMTLWLLLMWFINRKAEKKATAENATA